MMLFDHDMIWTCGNWLQANPLEHESDDRVGDTVAEFRSVVKDTKSNTKYFMKSISIHSDYQSVHFW